MPKYILLLLTLLSCPLALTAPAVACGNVHYKYSADVIALNDATWRLNQQNYPELVAGVREAFPALSASFATSDPATLQVHVKAYDSKHKKVLSYVASAVVRSRGELDLIGPTFTTPQVRMSWAVAVYDTLIKRSKKTYQRGLAEALVWGAPDRHDEAYTLFVDLANKRQLRHDHTALAYAHLLDERGEARKANTIRVAAEKKIAKLKKRRRPATKGRRIREKSRRKAAPLSLF